MEFLARPSEWATTDSERLATFLDSETGKRFLPTLADKIPVLLVEGEINKILIRTGVVQGAQSILQEIVALAHPASAIAVSDTNAYPPPEDDSKWTDGLKLTPDNQTNAEPETKPE